VPVDRITSICIYICWQFTNHARLAHQGEKPEWETGLFANTWF
jgi:hypothetical protein